MIASFVQKLLLSAGPLSGTKALTGPLDVSVEVTGRCNLNCIGCTDHSPILTKSDACIDGIAFDILLATVTRLCDELSEFRGCTVTFTGDGEPLLHPQLVEMVRYAKGLQLRTRLSTNGTLLSGQKPKQLIESGLDELVLSFWAVDSRHAEEVYPDRGQATLAAQLENLELLRQEKQSLKSSIPRTVLYHPFNRYSIEFSEQIMELAAKYGCDFVHFSLLRTRQGRVSALAPDAEQVRFLKTFSQSTRKFPVKHNLKDVILAYKLGEKVWDKTPCYVGWLGFYLNRAGHIQPCKMCRLPLGKIDQIRLKEFWNGKIMRDFRAKSATRRGQTELLDHCDCDYCCYAVANYRLHQRSGWLRPK